jgi:hypothetical protein
MKPVVALTVFAFAVCISSTTVAQEVVGTSVIDGLAVELLNDQTWRYRNGEEPIDGCEIVVPGVQFCGLMNGWLKYPEPNVAVNAAYRLDSLNYAHLVIEAAGTDQGIDAAFMLKAVLQAAANGQGVPVVDIPVLDAYSSAVSGIQCETIAYAVTLDGVDFIYFNTFVLSPDRAMQAITVSLASEMTDNMRHNHADFLNYIRIDEF